MKTRKITTYLVISNKMVHTVNDMLFNIDNIHYYLFRREKMSETL